MNIDLIEEFVVVLRGIVIQIAVYVLNGMFWFEYIFYAIISYTIDSVLLFWQPEPRISSIHRFPYCCRLFRSEIHQN